MRLILSSIFAIFIFLNASAQDESPYKTSLKVDAPPWFILQLLRLKSVRAVIPKGHFSPG